MKSFNEILNAVKDAPQKTLAVAAAAGEDALLAVDMAYHKGLAKAILVADEAALRKLAARLKIDLSPYEIIDEPDNAKAALQAVALVSGGKADIVMKGLVESGDFLRAVLDKDIGLRVAGQTIGSIGVFAIPTLNRLLLLTDCGFIPLPNLETKAQLIRGAVDVARKLGVQTPLVGALCAAETVNPKIPSTVEAKQLEEMNRRGEIENCVVAGPISLDLALSEKAAQHKGYQSPVAGKADILLMPNLETGNALYKSLVYFAGAQLGGVMSGAAAPVVFTSRADSPEVKLNTIALALYLAGKSPTG